jgi:O-antigen ligase
VQSDLARFGGWCFLAGVFLMVTGDGLTNFSEPFPAQAWPWLYLLPLVLACAAMVLAGRIGLRPPARASLANSALAGLLAAFALSTLLSQERTLSATALACVAGIIVFWRVSAQLLEDSRLLEATWIVAALAVLELAIRVILSRLNEGLDQIPLEVRSVTWLGKHQITWVFNLFAPFLLARFIGDERRWVSLFNGAVWAIVGLANYLLLARMGLLVFVLATLGVCFLNAAHWRRWIVLIGTAAAGAAIVVANNLRITTFVASTFLDRALNSGIDLRLRVWEEAWDMFRTHPITGIGLGTFDKIAYQMPATEANPDFQMNGWHAHNVPLHILTEAGVLGLAAWVFLWYVIVRALVHAWRTGSREQHVYAAATLASVAAFQILSMTEVLIAARVQASLQMNLTIALLMVLGMRMSIAAPPRPRD